LNNAAHTHTRQATLSVPVRFHAPPDALSLLAEYASTESGLVGLPITLAVEGQTLDVSVCVHVWMCVCVCACVCV
jgi:hypothetical protein